MNKEHKKNILKIIYLVVIFIFFISFSVNTAIALDLDLSDAFSGILEDTGREAGYAEDSTPEKVVGIIIQAALSLLGIIFLILMVYGGYLWMTARGEEQQVNKAKDTIRMAIIGLAIVIAAYAISYFVISAIGEGTLRPATQN